MKGAEFAAIDTSKAT